MGSVPTVDAATRKPAPKKPPKITGVWQSSYLTPGFPAPTFRLLTISTQSATGGFRGKIGPEAPEGVPPGAILDKPEAMSGTINGAGEFRLKFVPRVRNRGYEFVMVGTISSNGKTITGQWGDRFKGEILDTGTFKMTRL